MAVNGLAVIIVAIMMLQFGTSAENAARVRNSLIFQVGQSEDFLWMPDERPDDFIAERAAPPRQLAGIVQRLLPDSKERARPALDSAKRLALHLATNRQAQNPIQSNVLDAYERIVAQGDGYCADYSQVFTGLALTGGIPVREWGLGWKGFGFGHTFNEIFDSELGKWVFIDSFHSLYVVDADSGVPLSALEFQDRLRAGSDLSAIRFVPLSEDEFYFGTQQKALTYYTRGADQFFMFWGNDVFSYDENTFVRILSRLPRSVEVMAAILLGIHPSIRIVETNTNGNHIDMLLRARETLLFYFFLLFAGIGLLLVQGWLFIRARRKIRN